MVFCLFVFYIRFTVLQFGEMMKYRVKVDRMGRITIPVKIRRVMGIREGVSILEVEAREGAILIRLLVR